MRTGSRRYHIAALLVACMGGGVLYAGESAPPDVSPDRRLHSSFHAQASLSAGQDQAFATLQFEINFVDATLSRLAITSRSRNINPDIGPVASDFGSDLRNHNDRNSLNHPSRTVPQTESESAGPIDFDDISMKFWRQFDELTFQHAEILEREERLLFGALSSNKKRPNPSEFRAASPLRSLSDDHASGDRSGAQRSLSTSMIAAGFVGPWTPRVSLAAAALPGVGRTMDVRAGLHLHAIRNGCLSKSVPESPLAALRFPIRFATSSPAFILSFVSPASCFSLPTASQSYCPYTSPRARSGAFTPPARLLDFAEFAPDSRGAYSLSSFDHIASRLYSAAPRFELIGVSL